MNKMNMQSEKVTLAKAATMNIVNGQNNGKSARKVLEGIFAEMHDRQAAALGACAVLDELKASGQVSVKVSEVAITKIIDGIAYDTTEKTRNDTTANAKRTLAGAVNSAYSGYADKLIIVSEKSGPCSVKWEAVKEVDKVENTLVRLLDLLDCTEAEGQSIRHAVATLSAAREQAVIDSAHDAALAMDAERTTALAEAANRLATLRTTAAETAKAKGYTGKAAAAFVDAYLEMASGM